MSKIWGLYSPHVFQVDSIYSIWNMFWVGSHTSLTPPTLLLDVLILGIKPI